MQNIIIEKPYRFVPPYRGRVWSALARRFQLFRLYLRRQGIVGCEFRGLEKFQRSLQAGHGILLAPNHCRMADPMLMGYLAVQARCHLYTMASWHLFHQDWFTAWAIRRMGAFSVYREGVDRPAINEAVRILETAERPLVIFPEGAVSRTNDRLHALLDGVAFIARAAAKRRAKQVEGGQVIMHPVAIKYLFQGDLREAADGVLSEIEHRFSWRPQRGIPLFERIRKVGLTLLCLKELEYLDRTFDDALETRLQRLSDRLLCPLEVEWLGQPQSGAVVPRVKALRMKMLPDMVEGRVSADERQRRWAQLADIYLAQQVSCYPHDYLVSRVSVDRLLETIERYEEDLTDRARVHGQLKAIIEIGDPLEVGTRRERGADGDPLMTRLAEALTEMMDRLALESPLYGDAGQEA